MSTEEIYNYRKVDDQQGRSVALAHDQLELPSRLVEGELLGEREHEPNTLPQADGHHVLAEHEALIFPALWLQPVDTPAEVVGPVERLLANGPHRRLAARGRDPLDAVAITRRDPRAVHVAIDASSRPVSLAWSSGAKAADSP